MRLLAFTLASFTFILSGCADDDTPPPISPDAQVMDAQAPTGDGSTMPPDSAMSSDASTDAAPTTPDATLIPDATPDAMPDCMPSTGTMMVGTGAMRDNRTCLTWTTTRQAEGMRWSAIRQFCDDLELEGFDDWRMPTTEEALTWPIASITPTFYDAVLTAPRYVPMGTGASEVDGRFHVCAVAWYSGAAPACYWWGPANTNGTFCVRGTGVGLLSISEGCGVTCSSIAECERVAD